MCDGRGERDRLLLHRTRLLVAVALFGMRWCRWSQIRAVVGEPAAIRTHLARLWLAGYVRVRRVDRVWWVRLTPVGFVRASAHLHWWHGVVVRTAEVLAALPPGVDEIGGDT
ncbi:hypothetical protein [Amycolatopsis arida]|nr:hypothetical protein [Amycolatopsis arida]